MKKTFVFMAASLLALLFTSIACGSGSDGGGTAPNPVTGISVSPSNWEGKPNEERQLSATVTPANASGASITWTSSNTSVATVSESGNVRAITVGSAIITARTSNGVTGTCSVTVSPFDVYVAGWNYNRAVIWKNGQYTALPHGSDKDWAEAVSVFVSDNGDVYAAGREASYDGNYEYTFPVLWRNNVKQNLTLSSSYGYGEARSVFVSGSNVYVGGYEESSSGWWSPRVWRDGQPQQLNDMGREGAISSVYVRNNTVYAAGSLYNDTTYASYTATLWTNGSVQTLVPLSGATASAAMSVCVSQSGDVFVAGYSLINGNEVATIWENNTPKQLSYATYSVAVSVFASGNNIYAAGQENDGNNYAAAVWMGQLNEGYPVHRVTTANAGIYSIYVHDSVEYSVGVEFKFDTETGNYYTVPNCWRGNTVQTLSNAVAGEALSVFVR